MVITSAFTRLTFDPKELDFATHSKNLQNGLLDIDVQQDYKM